MVTDNFDLDCHPSRYLLQALHSNELVARDKANLDIFWLRDESLDDAASLEEPDVIAAEIIEDLQMALIYADLAR